MNLTAIIYYNSSHAFALTQWPTPSQLPLLLLSPSLLEPLTAALRISWSNSLITSASSTCLNYPFEKEEKWQSNSTTSIPVGIQQQFALEVFCIKQSA